MQHLLGRPKCKMLHEVPDVVHDLQRFLLIVAYG